jgi:hypothetical protein
VAFPAANILAKNGAVGGTPSAYALMCLDQMVEQDVDLVRGRAGGGGLLVPAADAGC